MKPYHQNKQPKDPRFLAAFRKSFNRDRLNNGFSIEESAHDLGMSRDTLDKKLKPSNDMNDITVTDWNHHLELSGEFSSLEYFALKHGYELNKLNLSTTCKSIPEINTQADRAMIEFNEAWKEIKQSIEDGTLSEKEKIKTSSEIDESIKLLQQLRQDLNCTKDNS